MCPARFVCFVRSGTLAGRNNLKRKVAKDMSTKHEPIVHFRYLCRNSDPVLVLTHAVEMGESVLPMARCDG